MVDSEERAQRSLVEHISSHRVSSVLNNDSKMYGKKHLFDGSEETCWNSNQGSPQHVRLKFKERVAVREIRIMFQGGFVAKTIDVTFAGPSSDKSATSQLSFEPEDNNSLQTFAVPDTLCERLTLTFPSSTDFYGRITIYQLDVIGGLASESESS